ncbi:MAG: ABC transporter ATP-binding protein/permease, partial [Alphaproteobacteria bacterium]|nr:ABC transporter ATP-binding protein/permease [Alphaproteobacteria bacterium]
MPAAQQKKETHENSRVFILLKRIFKTYLIEYINLVILAVIFMILAAAMTALIALLMQPILDDVLVAKKENLILAICYAVAATFVCRGVVTYVHTVLMNKIGQSIVADVQRDLFSHFTTMDMAFFHANTSGSLLARVVNDVNVMRIAVSDTLTGFGKSFFTLVFLVAVMFSQDWQLTLASFIVLPVVSGFMIYIGRRLRKISKATQSKVGDLSALLSQSFQGVRLIKSYNMEGKERERISNAINNVRDLNIKTVKVSTLSTPFNETLIGGIFAAIIAYGGYQVLNDQMTAGELASFIAAFTLAYEPLKKLSRLNNSLQIGLGASERIFEMMDTQPSVKDKENAVVLNTKKPDIIFDAVTFQYKDTDKSALNNISFNVPSGKVTALVGPSGCGKSTIINMILRFYDVDSGKITIDGTDIKDISLKSLRDHIALVSQDITIFNDTVADNIRYGKPDASQKEIEDAAEMAAAHEFIRGFPKGYDTIVGEHGVKLSGGQKQRISIARAILKDAPILL